MPNKLQSSIMIYTDYLRVGRQHALISPYLHLPPSPMVNYPCITDVGGKWGVLGRLGAAKHSIPVVMGAVLEGSGCQERNTGAHDCIVIS